ncbi:MAG TPA: 50S ribosomal protein L18 [Actinomycetes bacterium]|jgi:large subunit ribosomal protein L18
MAVGVKTGKGHAGKRSARIRRHLRVRKKVAGSSNRPRLVVSRSSRHILGQLVDDVAGHTLASASSMDETIRDSEGDKTARARQAGKLLAERATAAGFASVIFDRGGYRYHGRVAAFADGAREGGLEF